MTPDDLARIAEAVADCDTAEAVEATPAAARVTIADD
jgi:hypothetical protein